MRSCRVKGKAHEKGCNRYCSKELAYHPGEGAGTKPIELFENYSLDLPCVLFLLMIFAEIL